MIKRTHGASSILDQPEASIQFHPAQLHFLEVQRLPGSPLAHHLILRGDDGCFSLPSLTHLRSQFLQDVLQPFAAKHLTIYCCCCGSPIRFPNSSVHTMNPHQATPLKENAKQSVAACECECVCECVCVYVFARVSMGKVCLCACAVHVYTYSCV